MRVKFLKNITVEVSNPTWDTETYDKFFRQGTVITVDEIINVDMRHVNFTVGELVYLDIRRENFEVVV